MSRAPSARTIWLHGFVPLTVLALYLVSSSFFYSWLLPEYSKSVNAVFVDRAWKFVLAAAGVAYLIFIVKLRKTRGDRPALGDATEQVRPLDFILILLPLAPVVQYILNNQDVLSPLGSLYVLAVFAVFSVLFIAVIPTVLGAVGSTKTLMLLGVAFAFAITNMSSLSARQAWFQEGSLLIQLAVLGGVFAAGRLLYSNHVSRKFMYVFVVIFFVSGMVLQFGPGDSGKATPADIYRDNELAQLVGSRRPSSAPNIYLLVYESYVTNETMLAYGIDNSAQEEYLEQVGFRLYPHTYSIAGATISTMSRVLNACTEYYGHQRSGTSGAGAVQNLLKRFGYETYGIFSSDYMFRGIGSSYNFSFPMVVAVPSAQSPLVAAILMGEFRFDVDLEFDAPSRQDFLEEKASTFAHVPDAPRFIYVHDPFPGHSQNSGVCLPNETELYEAGLLEANRRMRQDVEALLNNDPTAIIIVAGDHGPYLTKNCTSTGRHYDMSEVSRLDIQDRYGTFLAIKWPDESFSRYDDITVLQDLFPAIFAYLFEDDGLLMAKVEPNTLEHSRISGAQVKNGIIYGGINDGEPLFLSGG